MNGNMAYQQKLQMIIAMIKPNDISTYTSNNTGYLIAFIAGLLIFRSRNIIFFFAKSILRLFKLFGRFLHHVLKTYSKVFARISGTDIVFLGVFFMAIRDILTVIFPFDEVRQYLIYFYSTIFTTWFVFAGLVLYIFRRIYARKT